MGHKPASTMIEVLTPIWQRLLQHSPIHVEDNFFDLGGDSSVAVELFNEIAKVSGRELPPVTIYHAPTITALAALLEHATVPRFPSLVKLKAGTEGPPVFIAHGLGGSAMEFFQLVRHIRSPHPIYGMQARGTDGLDEPFERIEDMAKFHLDAVRELQPDGPYLLVGYSLGGLVTLEMARRLAEIGEKVALLALLETYPHTRYVPLGEHVRLVARLARHHASAMRQLPLPQALSYLLRPSKRLSHFSRDGSGSVHKRAPIGVWFTPAMQRVRDSAYLALKAYRPRYYDGELKFVGAQTSSEFPDDPVAVWGDLAERFEVETVPGDHLGIITTHAEDLGSVLSRYLGEAFSQDRG